MKLLLHNKYNKDGFTLLELLLVLTIISILSAVAIPQYREFKVKAYDAKAQIELRNVSLAEELYYSNNDAYLTCSNNSCLSLPSLTKISDGIIVSVEAQEDSFIASAYHEKGRKTFTWDSSSGGLSEEQQ